MYEVCEIVSLVFRKQKQMLQTGIIFPCLAIALAFLSYIMFLYDQPNEGSNRICWQDTISGEGVIKCKPRCRSGSFGLAGMPSCHPLLRCTDWSDVKVGKQDMIGQGLVKKVRTNIFEMSAISSSMLVRTVLV